MKKLRLTVDKLEMQLRQKGVTKISDVRIATVEPNGQVGYELTQDAQPLTVGEFKKLMSQLGYAIPQQQPPVNMNTNLFDELTQPNNPPNPDHLH